MFKQPKPAGQPRSLRSIAETNKGENFPQEQELVNTQTVDTAAFARPTNPHRGLTSADKQPFSNLK